MVIFLRPVANTNAKRGKPMVIRNPAAAMKTIGKTVFLLLLGGDGVTSD
jgi:hypothetical protein